MGRVWCYVDPSDLASSLPRCGSGGFRIGAAVTMLAGVVLLAAAAGCKPSESVREGSVALAQPDPRDEQPPLDRWPQWRGPNACGIAPGADPAIRFSVEDAAWQVTVPGRGNSSPVVWGDRIFLTTALEQHEQPQLAVLCFRRADGHLLWQRIAGSAKGKTHRKNGYASATVACDGQRVVAFFGATGLFCYDMSGNLLWQQPLGRIYQQWGTAASPIFYRDLVIQLCDSEEDSYLAAFDRRTGQLVWRTDRESKGCWTTPVVFPPSDSSRASELIVNGLFPRKGKAGAVIAYDADSGEELWRVRGTTMLVTPTALIGSGLVISTSGRNGPIIAIRPGGRGDVTNSHVVWRLSRGGPYIPTGLVYRNRLLLVSDSGQAYCFDAANGRLCWRKRLRGPFTASLVAAAGRVYAVSEQGTVFVLAAADQFQLLAENHLGERCWATPAIVGKELFLRTQHHLYRFDGPAR